jgi:cell division protein ZapE
MLGARTDYRQEKTHRLRVYLTPLGEAADAAMDEAWTRLAAGAAGAPMTLSVLGRDVVASISPISAPGRSARATISPSPMPSTRC